MHRIDTPTAQKDKFGAGKNGFTRGNPQTGTPATDLDDDYFDMLQEELASVVEATSVTLDKTKRNQLLTAIKAHIASGQGVSYVTNGGVQYFQNGLIRQWGLSPVMNGSGVSADVVFPVPFPNEVHQIRTYDAGNPSPSINLAMASPTSLTGFRVWAVAAITAAGPALATWPTGRSTYWEAWGR
ncbi:gp53-like domain-containing protein [Leclercia adecarboxylata]|uniref:gp53-like domain-containing protein n=1 Tax=Leclercia adecarboxylata TaxID=83655 RepID=UPI001FAF39F1|nr:hypothetical protein [Leclercia adecarboxylata]